MRIQFKATKGLADLVRQDLVRPHPFAAERVGFLSMRAAAAGRSLVLFAEEYHPISDDDYVDDPTVGAMMGQEAIRKALNIALLNPVGMFHIHMHEHAGRPGFSRTDLREQPKFVPDFFKVRRSMPHGAIVLSHDRAIGRAWLNADTVIAIDEFNFIGSPMVIDIGRATSRVDFKI
jgi:hypothetical protein